MLEEIRINKQSSIRIAGEKILYFDPLEIPEEAHDADIIFITHDHFDHWSPDDVRKVMQDRTMFVVPAKMLTQVESDLAGEISGSQLTVMSPGDTASVCGIPVEAVAAYNVMKLFHPKNSRWNGYVVTMNGLRYYDAGDTDANEDNAKVRCDVALVPIGGTFTMDAKKAALFVNQLKPRYAVPIHYGSIVGKPEDADVFEKGVDPSVTVVRKL